MGKELIKPLTRQLKRTIAILAILLCFTACKKDVNPNILPVSSFVDPIEIPRVEFGFNLNDFKVVQDTIRSGDSFGQLLFNNSLSYSEIANITATVKDSFDVRKLNINKQFTILKSEDSLNKPQIFIYQPNKIDYIVVDFRDSIPVAQRKSKLVTIIENTASGVITSSLSETIEEQGLSYNIANDLSSIYAWTIDFFKLQKGDKFKIVYNEKFIDDTTYVGIERIKSAYFEHNNRPFYAFEFVADTINDIPDYFDEEGKTLRKAFLKAPLKFSRISSRFSPRRFHPVQKRWKAHKGTDYAALRGTPILSTANGKIIKSGYARGNGNYVKVRHNSTYSTQYLHMSKRAVKVGDFVKQGEVIGYVGSTGLATGPHVCYRFWKNGRQVDPYRQKLPEAKPMDKKLIPIYLESIQDIKRNLDQVSFKTTN